MCEAFFGLTSFLNNTFAFFTGFLMMYGFEDNKKYYEGYTNQRKQHKVKCQYDCVGKFRQHIIVTLLINNI